MVWCDRGEEDMICSGKLIKKKREKYGIPSNILAKGLCRNSYLNKIENGFKEPKRIKLNDYIIYWLETYKKNKIEPSSYARLFKVYQCQIKNSIGNKYIGDISTKDIQNSKFLNSFS